jgi:hypothetical protein
MAVTYAWEIDKLECYPEYEGESDVVFNVYWKYRGTETSNGISYSSKLVGRQYVTVDPTQEFVPFENLTLQIVSEWVELQMGEFQMQSMQTMIANNIQNQINPTEVSKNPPWA